MGLAQNCPRYVLEQAMRVKIVDHNTGMIRPWSPYEEQYRTWKQIALGGDCYFLKVRQIGLSTAVLLDDVMWCAGNDALGEQVKCGLYIDTDEKADEQLRRACDLMDQLGIAYRKYRGNVIYPNGSMLHFCTASGKRAGASLSFQRLHLTELPFWRRAGSAVSSLLQAVSKQGQIIIETTMGVEDMVAMNLWLKPNQFKKIFFSFEDHEGYRCEDENDPDFPLTPPDEEWLRGEGFTDPASMRYWLYLLRNRNAGDVNKTFREYPQVPAHAFRFAEGRWCPTDPKVVSPVDTYSLPEVPGQINIFRVPQVCSHHVVIGVDTAGGKGKDQSAVAVVDGRDGRVVASYVSADAKVWQLAQVAKSLQDRYKFFREIDYSVVARIPYALVETNGVGAGTAQELQRIKARVSAFDTTEHSSQRFMELTERAIRDGVCYGPEDLKVEVQQLRVSKGKFLGHKDLFISLGFCYDWLAAHPFVPLPQPRKNNTFNFQERRGRR